MIVILVHRPRQGILDRNHRPRRRALFQAAENVLKTRAGKHFAVRASQFAGGLFAECPSLALECNGPLAAGFGFPARHRSGPSQRRTWSSATPIRSSALSKIGRA